MNINLVVEPALTACFQFLSDSQRQTVEGAILSLPEDDEYAQRRRSAMLLALPEELIGSDGARRQRAEALTTRDRPEATPWPSDFLEDAPLRLEPNRSEDGGGPLPPLTAAVQQIGQRSGATLVDWSTAATQLRALDEALRRLQNEAQDETKPRVGSPRSAFRRSPVGLCPQMTPPRSQPRSCSELHKTRVHHHPTISTALTTSPTGDSPQGASTRQEA